MAEKLTEELKCDSLEIKEKMRLKQKVFLVCMGKVNNKSKALIKDSNLIISSIDFLRPLTKIDSTNNENIKWGKELKKKL